MSAMEWIHERWVLQRRNRILTDRLVEFLPQGARVLDVGCGDGRLDEAILRRRPDLEMEGLETQVRSSARISVRAYDGKRLPYPDASVDVVLFVDSIHHAQDPAALLREGARVAARRVIIKDHTRDGWAAALRLRWMDRIGNDRYGVAQPFHYWSLQDWKEKSQLIGLEIITWNGSLGLYPWPASLVFDSSLQFLAQLAVARRPSGQPEARA